MSKQPRQPEVALAPRPQHDLAVLVAADEAARAEPGAVPERTGEHYAGPLCVTGRRLVASELPAAPEQPSVRCLIRSGRNGATHQPRQVRRCGRPRRRSTAAGPVGEPALEGGVAAARPRSARQRDRLPRGEQRREVVEPALDLVRVREARVQRLAIGLEARHQRFGQHVALQRRRLARERVHARTWVRGEQAVDERADVLEPSLGGREGRCGVRLGGARRVDPARRAPGGA